MAVKKSLNACKGCRQQVVGNAEATETRCVSFNLLSNLVITFFYRNAEIVTKKRSDV